MFIYIKNLVHLIIIFIIPLSVYGEEHAIKLADQQNDIRGLVRPRDQAILSSEISGKIRKLPKRSGQRFNKGDLLVEFDCAIYEAELAAVKAQYEASQHQYLNNKELLSLNATSEIEVAISQAEAKKSLAEVEIRNIQVKYCQVKAPFKGRVNELLVNQYESVATDQKLLSIIDDSLLEIEIIVPSNWLSWLEEGYEFNFEIDETGETHKATVSQLGSVVDPVSQTIRVLGVFTQLTRNVLAGMSGTAYLKTPIN